ncbi:bifunctional metallophosphatase/5'-nucleotidase [Haliangium sp.]
MIRIDYASPALQCLRTLTLSVAVAAVSLAGCYDTGQQDGSGYDYEPDAAPGDFTLQILHASDMEAGGEAVEDAPRFSAILNALRSEYPTNTVVVSSGDNYIPGPFFSTGDAEVLKEELGAPAVGRADIAMLNAMGFQASALGNHEFDASPSAIANLLQSESQEYMEVRLDDDGNPVLDDDGNQIIDTIVRTYPGTGFPYLSVNLDISMDEDLSGFEGPSAQLANFGGGNIARSTLIRVGSELVGVVGATTPSLASISTTGGVIVGPTDEDGNTLADDLDALAATIQAEVDAVASRGINKIILLAHMQQIDVEKSLAPKLSGVDVIVAGGSNTLLADDNDRLREGDTKADDYPLQFTSASDEPVLVVNTDGNYRYVGRLVVTFDTAGVIKLDSIDANESGVYATDEQGVSAIAGAEPISLVAAIAKDIAEVIVTLDGTLYGKTSVYLNGERGSVRTEETNLGNLTADANLAIAQEADANTVVSIKNGGGIRASIGSLTYPPDPNDPIIKGPPAANPLASKEEGQISQLDIQNSLRFNNDLTLLTLTAEQLRDTVEHAVSATADGATPGRFPQIAGMTFSFDPALDPNKRVRTLTVLADPNNGGNDTVVVQDGTLQENIGPFRVVTLGFLAGGGDDYPFPSFDDPDTTDDETDRKDLLGSTDIDDGGITFAEVGSEQHALAKHLRTRFPEDTDTPFDLADTEIAQDQRIQRVDSSN